MTTPEAFLAASRGLVVAPAGCGKTELVARAVESATTGRQLLLTHTHAGVDALRSRLRRYRADAGKYRVDTIAGLCLRVAASYPATSGLSDPNPTGRGWEDVYAAALRVLDARVGRRLLETSYSGVVVDEYQDCTQAQHQVILRISDVLPTRLVGDPLQGIFGFGGQQLVNWEELRRDFEELPPLTEPWRWNDTNPELGRWLLTARQALTAGEPLDARGSPIRVMDGSTRAQHVLACHQAGAAGGSVVAIRKWARDAHATSRLLGGSFTSMEEMDCRDLQKFAEILDNSSGTELASALIKFSKTCMTEVGRYLTTASKRLAAGGVPRTRQGAASAPAVSALIAVAKNAGPSEIELAMRAIRNLPDAKLYRRELYSEALRSVACVRNGDFESFSEAAWHIRDRARHRGRRPDRRIISRTLLIKGLEFDHVLVLEPAELDARNLYVALTRGASSATVLTPGADPTIRYQST